MPSLREMIRDSPLAGQMFAARYGEADPYVLATQQAGQIGYPVPGSTNDVGEAQRYMSSNLAAEKYGVLPLLTNPLHEAALSWVAEGEGKPSLARLLAGYRGTFDALEAPKPAAPPVREGFGLQGAQISAAPPSGVNLGALLAAAMGR
jgi:hypothetical protein